MLMFAVSVSMSTTGTAILACPEFFAGGSGRRTGPITAQVRRHVCFRPCNRVQNVLPAEHRMVRGIALLLFQFFEFGVHRGHCFRSRRAFRSTSMRCAFCRQSFLASKHILISKAGESSSGCPHCNPTAFALKMLRLQVNKPAPGKPYREKPVREDGLFLVKVMSLLRPWLPRPFLPSSSRPERTQSGARPIRGSPAPRRRPAAGLAGRCGCSRHCAP
jgi:hypothetical protein